MKRAAMGQMIAGVLLFISGLLFIFSGYSFGSFSIRFAFTLAAWAGAAITLGRALESDPGIEARLRAAAAQMQQPAPPQQTYQAPVATPPAPPRMCVNGHAMAAGASFCTSCGAPAR